MSACEGLGDGEDVRVWVCEWTVCPLCALFCFHSEEAAVS